ncbi:MULTISPECIES: 4Fe-4S single cluster domain-containing protein [Sutcliffiella]|uniref:Ribonucleoside-triphosphate reductase activating protein n=1 Tax=Sutcliffiella cohnii TaxID=33932 RepID=A0A223KN28_9BACI|nr:MULTISPECIES: 4Fe-4S single cluster domain-containing protein [Sutcliffiella]AST90915.1 ribonucleoside-triphosphate reductase activating protein [Sutcliffiella cohnii]WBL16703.1 4Fe-4S single cluster domain-containing protein [Sutcliffiella sp. NC1]
MEVILHRFLPYTTSEGPGKRACIWVQGCPIHCKGCGVPWTWNPNKGTPTSVELLWEEILKSKHEHDIEGITLLGGEPFEQAEALSVLAKRAQAASLSVMTFSGYYKEQLTEMNKPGWEDLLSATDLFIDGPFEIDKPDKDRPWIGSTNQRIHFLTDRYKSIENSLKAIPNRLEFYIKSDGTIEANGMVPSETWKRILNDL